MLQIKTCNKDVETIHGTLLQTWMSNPIHYKVREEITYPFPNSNGCTVNVSEVISTHTLLGMWLLIHARQRGPGHSRGTDEDKRYKVNIELGMSPIWLKSKVHYEANKTTKDAEIYSFSYSDLSALHYCLMNNISFTVKFIITWYIFLSIQNISGLFY